MTCGAESLSWRPHSWISFNSGHMRFCSLPRFALVSAVVLGLACEATTGPGLRLEVSPDSVQLVRHQSAQLTVNALNSDGNLVTGVAVSFASNDTTIATVT